MNAPGTRRPFQGRGGLRSIQTGGGAALATGYFRAGPQPATREGRRQCVSTTVPAASRSSVITMRPRFRITGAEPLQRVRVQGVTGFVVGKAAKPPKANRLVKCCHVRKKT